MADSTYCEKHDEDPCDWIAFGQAVLAAGLRERSIQSGETT